MESEGVETGEEQGGSETRLGAGKLGVCMFEMNSTSPPRRPYSVP